jgi:L-seryl-tRNA(Ser) seleniumtransferase
MTMSEPPMDLKQIVNAAGTMTFLGAAAANQEAIDAAAAILIRAVEMPELHRAASRAIARATGAEAGCVTACAGAGISVAVAAAMTGDNLARIERLPDTDGLKNEIILQKGHNCHFSGEINQMVRLAGASVVEIGAVNRTTEYQLEGALGERTAAALYVVSHQTSQVGMIGLDEFCTICHAQGVPVMVDAAAEYDLHGFLARGADLAIYSAHKVLGGLTAGIIAGRKNLVRACYLQEYGIGRAMKVGKEGVASTIAVLQRWQALDKEALWRQEHARAERAAATLQDITGLAVTLEADPTGNPVTRVRIKVDAGQTGMDAGSLSLSLAAGNPAVYVRAHDIDPGSILLDPCNLSDAEMDHVCRCIAESVAAA